MVRRTQRSYRDKIITCLAGVGDWRYNSGMSELRNELLRAVELALAGEWDAAHSVVQEYEDDATAAWIHAVLHKVEGDAGNSRYWYRIAGKMERVGDEPSVELETIKAELGGR